MCFANLHIFQVTHYLGGENYVFWGGREGYQSLLNTDMGRELDHLVCLFSDILKLYLELFEMLSLFVVFTIILYRFLTMSYWWNNDRQGFLKLLLLTRRKLDLMVY